MIINCMIRGGIVISRDENYLQSKRGIRDENML
jgi:hypothetical protein